MDVQVMSQLFQTGGQSTGVSTSASVLTMNIQGWFPFGLTGLVSLQFKGISRVFSSTTVWNHQFFSAQPSLWSNSHIHRWLLEKPLLWLKKTLHIPVLYKAHDLYNGPGQYHKGPEYGAAGLYPGGASDLDVASVQPGHVCSSPGSAKQCAETPSLPHSQSAREEQQQEVVQFPPQFLSCTISSLSIWTLPPSLNLPGPDAQVRMNCCLGNTEHNTCMSSTLGPLWLYPELWYHFTSEIKGEKQTTH